MGTGSGDGAVTARPSPRRARVVVAGAGVAGLEVALAVSELVPGRAALELIDPKDEFVYRPLAVAEAFALGAPFRIGLDRFASFVGATRRRARVVAVDQGGRAVRTSAGDCVPYDLLVLASGARGTAGLRGALTFRGGEDAGAFRALLGALEQGEVGSLAFVVPPGASWRLPLYELALLTANRLARRAERAPRLLLVTPESRPLEQFGAAVSEAVTRRLSSAGIEARLGAYAVDLAGGELRVVPAADPVSVERVVTVPRLRGPGLGGVPCDRHGFLPADPHGRVDGCEHVYAAGDATSFPLKQAAVAVEQAEAAAEAIAARLGATIRPKPFRPILRSLLLAGDEAQFLWADPTGGRGETSVAAPYPLWWPPGKIAGGRLAGYLSSEGLPVLPPPAGPATAPVPMPVARTT
jgi:sulfide:quinone oxidoreductase